MNLQEGSNKVGVLHETGAKPLRIGLGAARLELFGELHHVAERVRLTPPPVEIIGIQRAVWRGRRWLQGWMGPRIQASRQQ